VRGYADVTQESCFHRWLNVTTLCRSRTWWVQIFICYSKKDTIQQSTDHNLHRSIKCFINKRRISQVKRTIHDFQQ